MKDKLNIISQIKSEKVFIYGAGTISDIVFYMLENNDISDKVQAFIVTTIGGNVATKFNKKVVEFNNISEDIKESDIILAVSDSLQDEIADYLKIHGIHNIINVETDKLIDDFFKELYKEPIDNKKVLLQNQQGQGYGCNPKYIADKLHSIDDSLDLIWAVNNYIIELPSYIRPVLFGTIEYYKELATSKVWIDNSRKPISIRKRLGQYYVQAWHGAAPIKKVEADATDALPEFYIRSAKHDSNMADIFVSGSRFYSDLYRKSFWYQGEIMEVGLPRQDVFFSDNTQIKNKIYKRYGIKKENKIILYSPTFRTHIDTNCYDLDIDRIREAFSNKTGEQYTVLVSRHPVNYQQYNFPENAKYISVADYGDFEELLAIADILISDYSGCVYDYSFTRRPIFLYQKDYEDYLGDRDFYIPMEKLPYIKAHSNNELVEKIVDFNYDDYRKNLDKFMNSMGNFDDGNASIKIANYIYNNVIIKVD